MIIALTLHQKSEMISIFDILIQTNNKGLGISTLRGAYYISQALTETQKGQPQKQIIEYNK